MSLEFLTPSDVIAESPLAQAARHDGATLKVRDGWLVPARFDPAEPDAPPFEQTVAWADLSPLGKFELRGAARLDAGAARVRDGSWWCPVAPSLTLVLAEPDRAAATRDALGDRALDVTAQYGALLIAGARATETIARFCALDLRRAEAGSFRPGSIARTPGHVLCEAPDRYLLLFGAAVSEYMWSVVSDAGRILGGRPAGWDALSTIRARRVPREAAARA